MATEVNDSGRSKEVDMQGIVQRLRRSDFVGRAMNRAAEQCAQAANRFLYKPHVSWWSDRTWIEPYLKYVDGDRILDRRFTLVKWAEAARRLQGSTAECGVYTGVTSALICKALEGTYQAGEIHYGFDSFEGLPEPVADDRSPQLAHGSSFALRDVLKRGWRRGDLTSPIEVARRRVEDFPYCRLVKGWIPDCFETIGDDRFRLVHVDVDLYQPTIDSLEFFYPRMVSQGIMILDDYGMMSCVGARRAVDQFFADKPEVIVELSTGQAIMTKL